MSNVIKFPRQEENAKQPKPQYQKKPGNASDSTLRNIMHGVIGAVYLILVILWIPVRFMLIANVVLQFFRMLFKWGDGPFTAAWPFMLSFLVLAAMTYIMATWKPKVP